MLVYNPLPRTSSFHITIPTKSSNPFNIVDEDGNFVPFQSSFIPSAKFSIPGRASDANMDTIFKAVDVPPFGKTLYIKWHLLILSY